MASLQRPQRLGGQEKTTTNSSSSSSQAPADVPPSPPTAPSSSPALAAVPPPPPPPPDSLSLPSSPLFSPAPHGIKDKGKGKAPAGPEPPAYFCPPPRSTLAAKTCPSTGAPDAVTAIMEGQAEAAIATAAMSTATAKVSIAAAKLLRQFQESQHPPDKSTE
ncbi:hypothetical protein OC834_006566 [Tilletia horrida]|nr:hypothetical protein OC834_006566 [Tilletia horrida]